MYHGNTSPPQRREFLDEMMALATDDQPDVVCFQEVPAWALSRFPVGDVASRPPLGRTVGRAVTSAHHGLIRGGLEGQGLAIWLGPAARLLERSNRVLNPRANRREQAHAFGLSRRQRLTWAKERRIVQVVRVQVGGDRLAVANVHCTPFPEDLRITETELLSAADFLLSTAASDEIAVLAGDFNVGPEQSLALARLSSRDYGFSSPAGGIDQVLVRGTSAAALRVWPVERRRRPDGRLLSDHAPVELDLELP
jgi:endonuclease/exonuclease/phosphatase family metal-dependent hydrolase